MHSVPSALLLLLPLLTPTAQPVTDQNRRKLPTAPHEQRGTYGQRPCRYVHQLIIVYRMPSIRPPDAIRSPVLRGLFVGLNRKQTHAHKPNRRLIWRYVSDEASRVVVETWYVETCVGSKSLHATRSTDGVKYSADVRTH